MKFKLELHIPDAFFESAKAENDFESLSEQISKTVLGDILKIDDIQRGNPQKSEPDYVANKTGYEVTLGIDNSLIPMLRGRKKLSNEPHNWEQGLIDSINKAIAQKATKHYCLKTNLVILTLTPLLEWYSWFYLSECSTYYWWELLQVNRNKLFHHIYKYYIETSNVFEDILILQPTHDEHYILYSVKDYAQDNSFMTKIGIKKEQKNLFPRYSMIGCEQGTFPIIYEISEVLYK